MDIKKYRRFVKRRLPKLGRRISIIVALIVTVYLFVQSFIPMSANELKQHNEKLELLKQDFANLDRIEGVSEEIQGDTITIVFDGKECDMKAVFGKDGTYMYRIITDDRVCTNFGRSCLVILLWFTSTGLFMTVIEMVLHFHLRIIEAHAYSKNKKYMEASSYEKH